MSKCKNKICWIIAISALMGCKGFLDVKSDRSMVVPQSMNDLRGILDNSIVMNGSFSALPEIGSDNYYLTSESWDALWFLPEKNAYAWKADLYESDNTIMDWKYPYQQIFNANLVLEKIEEIDVIQSNGVDYRNIKGSAYFYRAWATYQLAQLFCKTYDSRTASNDLGLPLKMESDINIIPKRSTVEETYQHILSDLAQASMLLDDVSSIKTHPSKQASQILLSKTYLVMDDFENSYKYADSALMVSNTLLDLNEMNIFEDYPFAQFNDEVVFHSTMVSSSVLYITNLLVDSLLYNSYKENDLRKIAFFTIGVNNIPTFKGSYNGDHLLFSGLSINEAYLLKAECAARLGRFYEAARELSFLLEKRYSGYTETDPSITNDKLLLEKILIERRKELIFRGARWTDLRRLNKTPEYATILYRKLNDQLYTLLPNSTGYVLPIPDIVVGMSGLEQNIRE